MLLRPPFSRRPAGSALIMALWALLLLSAAVFAWVKFIDGNILVTGQENSGLDAKALAHSGIVAALHPDVTLQTPILAQQFGGQRGYRVQMTGEGGKLNLNWLFAPPEHPDPNRLAIFERYLERRGLNFEQRAKLVDCILDWLDRDNLRRLNGAEEDANYHPPNRGFFTSVEELVQVKSSGPLVSQPGWQDDFTIYTNPGLVDLQSASRLVLAVLPNIGDANADRFIKMRRGPDGLDGTLDDHVFTVKDAMAFLGLGTAQAQQLMQLVYVETPLTLVHLISTGTSGGVSRSVEVVAKKSGMQPTVYSWKEL